MEEIKRISIPVTTYISRDNGHDTYMGWPLDHDGVSVDLAYTEGQLRKNLQKKAIDALREHKANESNSQQRILLCNDGTVFMVQYRHGSWCYSIVHPDSTRGYAGSCHGRQTFDDCLKDAKNHAETFGGIKSETSL